MNAEIITLNGQKLAVLPLDLWESILEKLEDFEDIMDAKRIEAETAKEGNDYFPYELIKSIRRDGKNRIRAYREHRKLSIEELAKKSGVSVHMIRKLEADESKGSVDTIKAIAKALNVEMSWLVKD